MKSVWAVILIALATTAAAAAVLPLRPGMFVLKDQPCADPAFAAMFQYDGREFSYPHASRCRSTVLSHVGRAWRRRETCYALGDGTPAVPLTTVSSYEIKSATEVLVSDEAHSTAASYRWCSAPRHDIAIPTGRPIIEPH